MNQETQKKLHTRPFFEPNISKRGWDKTASIEKKEVGTYS